MGRGIGENEHDVSRVRFPDALAGLPLPRRSTLHCVIRLYTHRLPLHIGLLGCCLVCGVVVSPSLLAYGGHVVIWPFGLPFAQCRGLSFGGVLSSG